jgi:hypothetical protein
VLKLNCSGYAGEPAIAVERAQILDDNAKLA